MKTKIFKHKLLAVGTAVALGLCLAGTAQAGALSHSTIDTRFLITPKDASGEEITLQVINFAPDPNANASATKQMDTLNDPIDDLQDADGGEVDAEACVGTLANPANPDCTATKPNTHEQQAIADGNDFCRGKTDLTEVPLGTELGLEISEGAHAITTSECQFDRQNWGEGDSGIGFSAGFTIGEGQGGTTLTFGIENIPRMESFCHEDPLFFPRSTSRMTTTITIVNENDQQIFAFNPDGVVNPPDPENPDAGGETADEASLNLAFFCNQEPGSSKIYDPINNPGPVNDCTTGNPALCEYSATSGPLPEGTYTMTVSQNNDSEVHKEEVPPMVNGDHFLCYKSFGHFLREEVGLLDQFEDKNFKMLKPKMFCNPAIKPVRDPEAELAENPHYLSYKIKKGHRVEGHESRMAEVTNQFGTIIVETMRPDRLMVPSGKSVVLPGIETTFPPIPPAGLKTNHYKCYTVRADNFQQQDVVVKDQFTDGDGKNLTLVRPERLCTPVEKTRSNGDVTPFILDPVIMPLDHLMCYMVRAARGEKHHKKTKVLSSNQFRDEELVLKRELEFCVPSRKTLLTTTPDQ